MKKLCIIFALAGGCALDPLVDDTPGASVNILPPGTEVPYVATEPERVHQITVHDGLDDGDLEEAGGIVARIEGFAAGAPIRYWGFGNAPKIASSVYVLVNGGAPIEHPYLLDTVPGDPAYSPIRRIQHVAVTPKYRGEVLASLEALWDAIDLGLVEEPVSTGTFFDAVVVPPGTTLETSSFDYPAEPIEAYARGLRVDVFVFGGALGIQPVSSNVPVGQVAVLREQGKASYSGAIFQHPAPTEAPTEDANWTPLVNVVEVDLADGVLADAITSDADLFVRSGSGRINGVTALVDDFEVTEIVRNWPLQFEEGSP